MSKEYWDNLFDDEDNKFSYVPSDDCLDCDTKTGLVTSICPYSKWVEGTEEMVTLCDNCYEKRVKMAEDALEEKH